MRTRSYKDSEAALQRLLAGINAGRIRMVVLNKIDPRTRSLADFAKLVERFDATGCSFVSVTQAFNTASSMGRLTLNVLLSFAQFEREVTAERIRNKIAASKKQGLWMGGLPPLGCDPHPDPKVRELVVNPAEAETIRTLFTLYDQQGTLIGVEREAAQLGLRSKRHLFPSGRRQGGVPLSRGQIHKILVNPVYLGKIRHKDQIYPGRHPAILDEALWNAVQARLQAASARRRGHKSSAASAALTGKLRDETGDRLTPTHSIKAGQRHAYYVSNRLISGGPDATGWRLQGPKLERTIATAIADHIARAATGHRLEATPDLRIGQNVVQAARDLVRVLRAGDPGMLRSLLRRDSIAPKEITLALDRAALASALCLSEADLSPDLAHVCALIELRRRGVEAKLVLGTAAAEPDPVLLRTLADAHHWIEAQRTGTPIAEIARAAGHHQAYIRIRTPLAFLSPDIQAAIRDGTQPPELTLNRIMRHPMSLDWDEQARIYRV